VVFADYSLESWWYAFDLASGTTTATVYRVDGANADLVVAESISEFLRQSSRTLPRCAGSAVQVARWA
jgi:hypothetical protein